MKTIDLHGKSIFLSRTDSIGDVLLTIPLVLYIKKNYPSCKIYFLGKAYTRPILERIPAIDHILSWDDLQAKSNSEQIQAIQDCHIDIFVHVFPNKEIAHLAKQAGVPVRIGTSHRLFHWNTCTIKPNFTRKNSALHEAQLNFKLLEQVANIPVPSKEELAELLAGQFQTSHLEASEKYPFIKAEEPYIILHPKSQGSAREWPIESYFLLAENLVMNGYIVLFSGTEKEGLLFRDKLPQHPAILDITGHYSLSEFIDVIAGAHALVACSTGPLHIAAFTGIKAIGLYNETKPIHSGRWSPIGKNVQVLSDFTQLNLKSKELRYLKINLEEILSQLLK